MQNSDWLIDFMGSGEGAFFQQNEKSTNIEYKILKKDNRKPSQKLQNCINENLVYD